MCLAIPGKILEIDGSNELMRMGRVDFGGVVRDICLTYVPEAGVGDYVIVHTGFAINRLDEESAKESLELLEEMALLQEEIGSREA
jgi:hydrogenase expression/formation protein HypC